MKITDKYVFFWGGPFSQWFASSFRDEKGITYSCAEQYMMAQKALLFGDVDIYNQILSTDNPKQQKALGRKVRNFDPKKWDIVCKDIVKQGNMAKFSQNPKLKQMLRETGDRKLVEASPYDKIWGIGLGENDPRIHDEKNWQGKNYLGEVLMEVRDLLKLDNI